MINEITEDFEEIVAVIKSKELKRYAKNILSNYKNWKKYTIKNKKTRKTIKKRNEREIRKENESRK